MKNKARFELLNRHFIKSVNGPDFPVRDQDFHVEKGGMAGLSAKQERDSGICEPYCGPSISGEVRRQRTVIFFIHFFPR